MPRAMLTGNAAAAWGARLAQIDYVPAFPITPQAEIIETVARWCATGEMTAKLVMMDSEHSMFPQRWAPRRRGSGIYCHFQPGVCLRL